MSLDTALGEHPWPEEDALAIQIADTIRAGLADKYTRKGQPVQRDAHPKAHGVVRAELRVEEQLPPALAQGVFVPGARYAAWVRFSNASPDAERADIAKDGRGMAVKLLGVPGEKMLAHERSAQTQDFVFISHPTFFVDDPARYLTFFQRSISHSAFQRAMAPLALGLRGLFIAIQIASLRIASPLETRYWSTVPLRLGAGPDRQAVKLSMRPSATPVATLPSQPGPNFLREELIRALGAGEARFDLLVQARSGPEMSVEDSRSEWDEAQAPFVKVATLHIPRQRFDSPEQRAFGENLSFTPWHCLPEHQPLGVVNRVRRVVYEAVSTYRHQINGVERREPTGHEQFPD